MNESQQKSIQLLFHVNNESLIIILITNQNKISKYKYHAVEFLFNFNNHQDIRASDICRGEW